MTSNKRHSDWAEGAEGFRHTLNWDWHSPVQTGRFLCNQLTKMKDPSNEHEASDHKGIGHGHAPQPQTLRP